MRQQAPAEPGADAGSAVELLESGGRSNLPVKRHARGRVVPPILYHYLGLEWNTISRVLWRGRAASVRATDWFA